MLKSKVSTLNPSSQNFLLPNYRRFQLMRFSTEEINNSSDLLPGVSLGYEIFDICSDLQSFPGLLKQISVNGSVQPWSGSQGSQSKVIGVVGPFTSTQTFTVAPLFMLDFISMVNVLIAEEISNSEFILFLLLFCVLVGVFVSKLKCLLSYFVGRSAMGLLVPSFQVMRITPFF